MMKKMYVILSIRKVALIIVNGIMQPIIPEGKEGCIVAIGTNRFDKLLARDRSGLCDKNKCLYLINTGFGIS